MSSPNRRTLEAQAVELGLEDLSGTNRELADRIKARRRQDDGQELAVDAGLDTVLGDEETEAQAELNLRTPPAELEGPFEEVADEDLTQEERDAIAAVEAALEDVMSDPIVDKAIAAARARSAGAVAVVALVIAPDGEVLAMDNVDNAHAGKARAEELEAMLDRTDGIPLVVSVDPTDSRLQRWDGDEPEVVDRTA